MFHRSCSSLELLGCCLARNLAPFVQHLHLFLDFLGLDHHFPPAHQVHRHHVWSDLSGSSANFISGPLSYLSCCLARALPLSLQRQHLKPISCGNLKTEYFPHFSNLNTFHYLLFRYIGTTCAPPLGIVCCFDQGLSSFYSELVSDTDFLSHFVDFLCS